MYSCKIGITSSVQRKYVSDSQGLVGFAIGLANSVFNLPDGKGMFFEEFENRRTVKLILVIKKLLGCLCLSLSYMYNHRCCFQSRKV